MNTGYMNALGALLMCVFIVGTIIAFKVLFKWRYEEQEAVRLPTVRRLRHT